MEWYEIYDVSERFHTIVNPSTPEKIIKSGEVAEMASGLEVIDFGCGFAESLVLWAEVFGITGTGIEFRPYAARRARERVAEKGLSERIAIVEGDASTYEFKPHSYEVASCLGASFIWKGYRDTIRAMKAALKPGGRMIIGEPYWLEDTVPPEYAQREKIYTERELLEITREEGYTFAYVAHSSVDDWDRYEANNWRSMLLWLRENPDHPDRAHVADELKKWQDDYVTFGRAYLGWAIYNLVSV